MKAILTIGVFIVQLLAIYFIALHASKGSKPVSNDAPAHH